MSFSIQELLEKSKAIRERLLQLAPLAFQHESENRHLVRLKKFENYLQTLDRFIKFENPFLGAFASIDEPIQTYLDIFKQEQNLAIDSNALKLRFLVFKKNHLALLDDILSAENNVEFYKKILSNIEENFTNSETYFPGHICNIIQGYHIHKRSYFNAPFLTHKEISKAKAKLTKQLAAIDKKINLINQERNINNLIPLLQDISTLYNDTGYYVYRSQNLINSQIIWSKRPLDILIHEIDLRLNNPLLSFFFSNMIEGGNSHAVIYKEEKHFSISPDNKLIYGNEFDFDREYKNLNQSLLTLMDRLYIGKIQYKDCKNLIHLGLRKLKKIEDNFPTAALGKRLPKSHELNAAFRFLVESYGFEFSQTQVNPLTIDSVLNTDQNNSFLTETNEKTYFYCDDKYFQDLNIFDKINIIVKRKALLEELDNAITELEASKKQNNIDACKTLFDTFIKTDKFFLLNDDIEGVFQEEYNHIHPQTIRVMEIFNNIAYYSGHNRPQNIFPEMFNHLNLLISVQERIDTQAQSKKSQSLQATYSRCRLSKMNQRHISQSYMNRMAAGAESFSSRSSNRVASIVTFTPKGANRANLRTQPNIPIQFLPYSPEKVTFKGSIISLGILNSLKAAGVKNSKTLENWHDGIATITYPAVYTGGQIKAYEAYYRRNGLIFHRNPLLKNRVKDTSKNSLKMIEKAAKIILLKKR